MNFERNHLKYIKSQKVLGSAYLRLDSVEENIEGDANLHHTPSPPGIGLKAFLLLQVRTQSIFVKIHKKKILRCCANVFRLDLF